MPYPHEGSCPKCRAEKRCNGCGMKLDPHYGTPACTNGRCPKCHLSICTPGESHGFGLKPEQVHAH